MTTTPPADFDAKLATFIDLIQKRDDSSNPYVKHKFYAMHGTKYIRIVREDVPSTLPIYHQPHRSVHCFVDASNGDILKADGWKRPAKHARGNIFAADPMAQMGTYGTNYLR